MKKSVLKATAQSGSNLLKAMEVFAAVAETGQMTAAARMLGISRPTFYRLLHKHQLG